MKHTEQEQSICISCGFCCDGTLFNHANLNLGEIDDFPLFIKSDYIKTGNKEVFIQPCAYFHEKCSIYKIKKPFVCTSFRCQLLKDFTENKIDLHRALKIVEGGKLMREDIFRIYSDILPDVKKQLNFRLILQKLIIDQKEISEDTKRSIQEKILIGKCNIFEALLIRYFKSIDDYKQMIETKDDQST